MMRSRHCRRKHRQIHRSKDKPDGKSDGITALIRKEAKENPNFTPDDIATELFCPAKLVRKVLKLPEPEAIREVQ